MRLSGGPLTNQKGENSLSIFDGMKRIERTSSKITKSILEELGRAQKSNDKVVPAKPAIPESPVKSPDLSHDAGGAYNTDLSFLQQ